MPAAHLLGALLNIDRFTCLLFHLARFQGGELKKRGRYPPFAVEGDRIPLDFFW